MPSPADLDKLKSRIEALRAKTIANGCSEAEALAAAGKVAELLDRYDLSLSDVEIRATRCERVEFETLKKKRVPLEACVGAVAEFCDCAVWREKSAGGHRYVFFGLPGDVSVALTLTELIDTAVRTELGRFKTSRDYQQFRHSERHLANASFALGMVESIAEKLVAMKQQRDQANRSSGRELMVVKAGLVEKELAGQGIELRQVQGGGRRMVSMDAYAAGDAAGTSLGLQEAIAAGPRAHKPG
jgi:hypothetical protein